MVPDTLVPALLLAGVVAGVLLLAAGFLGRLGKKPLAEVVAALAAGAGYAAGAVVLAGKPDVGAADVQKWVVLLAPAAALVGVLEGTVRPAWARLLAHVLYLAAVVGLVLRPLLGSWSTSEAVTSCGGFAVVSLGALGALSAAGERLAPRWAAVATFAFAAGSSFLLVIQGSVLLGLLAGCVAATAGAAVAASLLGFGLEKGRALPGTVGALAALLWARSYFYGDLKPAGQAAFVVGVVLLALAPLAALLAERLTKGTQKPGKAVLVRLAVVGLPVVLALGLAAATSPRFAPTEAGGEGY